MRKVIGIIAIALVCLASFGTFFGLSRGVINNIAGFEFQTVNEANYIKADDYVITSTEDESAAIKVSIDDGIITVEGKNETEETVKLEVTKVSLDAGEYEVVSNAKGCSKDTYQLILEDADGGTIIADEEFTVDAGITYTVYIVVYAGAEVDTEFAPTLVNKGENTSFLVSNWNPFKK